MLWRREWLQRSCGDAGAGSQASGCSGEASSVVISQPRLQQTVHCWQIAAAAAAATAHATAAGTRSIDIHRAVGTSLLLTCFELAQKNTHRKVVLFLSVSLTDAVTIWLGVRKSTRPVKIE